MSAVADIKSSLDLSQVAQFLGTDEQTAATAVDQALTQLVGAMDANAGDAARAAGLTKAALGDHLTGSSWSDQVDINDVDASDGEKIVSHVLSPTQIQSLSSGSGGSLLQRLLPILAPLVMGYLASKLQERMGGATQKTAQEQSGGGLDDLLGGLLGGSGSGGGLGDLLGGLFGGSGQQTSQEQATTTTQQTSASATQSGGTGGFTVPTSQDSGLRMDTTGSSTTTSASTSGAGDLLGGLLQEILLGRR